MLQHDDPTDEIGAARGVKELLRHLLAAPTAHDARHRLHRIYEAALTADMPETTRLAETVQAWWPEIEAFLKLRITNAPHRGRQQGHQADHACRLRLPQQANYERRIVLHVAAKSAA
jgi:transposase